MPRMPPHMPQGNPDLGGIPHAAGQERAASSSQRQQLFLGRAIRAEWVQVEGHPQASTSGAQESHQHRGALSKSLSRQAWRDHLGQRHSLVAIHSSNDKRAPPPGLWEDVRSQEDPPRSVGDSGALRASAGGASCSDRSPVAEGHPPGRPGSGVVVSGLHSFAVGGPVAEGGLRGRRRGNVGGSCLEPVHTGPPGAGFEAHRQPVPRNGAGIGGDLRPPGRQEGQSSSQGEGSHWPPRRGKAPTAR